MKSQQLPVTNAKTNSSSEPSEKPSSVANNGGYWRSVNELEQTPDFEEFLHREFPQAASEFPEGVSRRKWLKLMSASMALGGLAGCRYGPNEIASLVVRPENTVPGVPRHYATNFELAGRAVNLMVTNMDGRPIKLEGNANHPVMKASEPNDLSNGKERFASAGTDVFSQGCVLGLYDPDRTSKVYKSGESELEESSWEDFSAYAATKLGELAASGGDSLAILMSPSLSPSLNWWVKETVKALPKATVAQFASVDTSAQARACSEAAGKPAELLLDLTDAKVICCLDSDLLGNDPNSVLYSRQFSKGRTPVIGKMNRLYSAESRYSITGAAADTRIPLKSSQIGPLIAELEKRVDALLGGGQATAKSDDEKAFDQIDTEEQIERFLDAIAEDLVANKGTSVVSVGAFQSFEVQMAALRINKKLGNTGKTVKLLPSRTAIEGVEAVSIDGLCDKLSAGEIKNVWVLGNNPVYSAPGALDLAGALEKLSDVVYFADFVDETAAVSSWVLPLSHPLESWGDVLSVDGSYGVCQPQILPLLGGKSAIEMMAMLHGKEMTGEEIVKTAADTVTGKPLTSREWRETLHNGFLKSEPTAALEVANVEAPSPMGSYAPVKISNGELEVVVSVSDTLYDGRFAKNVWMQELPQAMTKLVWDNAAIIGPKTAELLGLPQKTHRSMTETIKLTIDDRSIELPAFIMPGQAPGSITVHMGYGRVCRDEAVDSDEQVIIGSNVSPLRAADNGQVLTGVTGVPTSRPYKLASTQDHFAIDNGLLDIEPSDGVGITAERSSILVREGTLEQIDEGGKGYVEHQGTHHPALESLWEEPINMLEGDPTVPNQWGMTVDLNKCTGCSSCVVACQAENNIAVVGKEQVSRGREMHWIRVDRYFKGDIETPKIVNQPVACAHCETAPCEQVCPVAATVHTEEGINAMAYNRCIGTRYCANNCPYKVRRFNYFNYNTEYGYFYGWEQRGKLEEASRKLQQLVLNPEVSVRGRGVMEKCTYCIQRVQNGKITARTEGRPVGDGEIQSACQTACPTQAIVFGNIKDPNSKVSQLRSDPRNYAMLAELNIKPRTTYLARVRNTHPRLMTVDQLEDPHHGHGAHGEDAHGDSHSDDSSHSEESHGENHSESTESNAAH